MYFSSADLLSFIALGFCILAAQGRSPLFSASFVSDASTHSSHSAHASSSSSSWKSGPNQKVLQHVLNMGVLSNDMYPEQDSLLGGHAAAWLQGKQQQGEQQQRDPGLQGLAAARRLQAPYSSGPSCQGHHPAAEPAGSHGPDSVRPTPEAYQAAFRAKYSSLGVDGQGIRFFDYQDLTGSVVQFVHGVVMFANSSSALNDGAAGPAVWIAFRGTDSLEAGVVDGNVYYTQASTFPPGQDLPSSVELHTGFYSSLFLPNTHELPVPMYRLIKQRLLEVLAALTTSSSLASSSSSLSNAATTNGATATSMFSIQSPTSSSSSAAAAGSSAATASAGDPAAAPAAAAATTTEGPDIPIHITGHSLGAAQALLLAAALKRELGALINIASVVVFGTPAVGSQSWVEMYSATGLPAVTTAVWNDNDLVPASGNFAPVKNHPTTYRQLQGTTLLRLMSPQCTAHGLTCPNASCRKPLALGLKWRCPRVPAAAEEAKCFYDVGTSQDCVLGTIRSLLTNQQACLESCTTTACGLYVAHAIGTDQTVQDHQMTTYVKHLQACLGG